jgi:putative hydrolase of the HAD superfamily
LRTVICFDLDDTLFPEREFVLSGFAASSAWLEREFGVTGLEEVAHCLFRQGQRNLIYDLALTQLGLADPGLARRLVDVYRSHRPNISLPVESMEILEQLRENSCSLAIITDGHLKVQQNKLAALGLGKRVDLVVYSDEHGRAHWKPNVLPYRKVMSHFGVPGEACVYIGDNPSKDFIGARELGWKTVRCRIWHGDHFNDLAEDGHEADTVIHCWQELLPAIQS